MTNYKHDNTILHIDISNGSKTNSIINDNSNVNFNNSREKLTPYKSFKPVDNIDNDNLISSSYIKDSSSNLNRFKSKIINSKDNCNINKKTLEYTISSNIKEGFTETSNLEPISINDSSEYKNTDFKDLVVLILFILFTLIVGIIFKIYPFIFWTQHADKEVFYCDQNKLILDRYFSNSENDLPYNFKILDSCPIKPRTPRKIDQCPADTSDDTDINNSSKNTYVSSGGSFWNIIEKFLHGFPYSLINSDKQEQYKFVKYKLLLMTLGYCTLLFLLTFPFFFSKYVTINKGKHIVNNYIIMFGSAILSLFFIPLVWYLFVNTIKFKDTTFKVFEKDILDSENFRNGSSMFSAYLSPGGKRLLGLAFIWQIWILILYLIDNASMDKGIKYGWIKYILPSIFMIAVFIKIMNNTDKVEHHNNGKDELDDYNFKHAFSKYFYEMLIFIVECYKNSSIKSNNNIHYIIELFADITKSNINTLTTCLIVIPFLYPCFLLFFVILLIAGFIGSFWGIIKTYFNNNIERHWHYLPVACLIFFLFPLFKLFINIIIYLLVPLTHSDILGSTIICNIKALSFLFSSSILISLWSANKYYGSTFVPEQTLSWMTLTFVVLTIIPFVKYMMSKYSKSKN